MADETRMDRPAPDVVEPGVPATEDQPQGVPPGWEADEQPPPLDEPQGVDQWGTTAREESLGESFRARVGREVPDRPAPPEGGVRILEPGDEDGIDDEPDAVAEVNPRREDTLAPEEAAMRVEDEPAGLTYDDDPGYVDRTG